MKCNIKIEWVSSVEFDYPYLEVFYQNSNKPFLDIGITSERELKFKFYATYDDLDLTVMELENILNSAKDFLQEALKNRDYFLKWDLE